MFGGGPKYQKLTTNLRLAVNRLKMLEKKKTEQAVKARREIADYLSNGKEERARIRVEHIIREDYMVEGMEIIEMYCDLLLARMGLIQASKELDEGLEEPVATIIWASPRLQAEVAELKVITDQLTSKYGKEYAHASAANTLNKVNEKVMLKLGVEAPPKMLVESYLVEIAKSYNIPYTPEPEPAAVDEVLQAEGLLIDFNEKRGGGGGGGGGMAVPMQPYPAQAHPPPAYFQGGYPGGQPTAYAPPPVPGMPPQGAYPPAPQNAGAPPPAALYQEKPPGPANSFAAMPELPSVPDSMPPGASTSAGGESVDFDDLTRRFEELKKRK